MATDRPHGPQARRRTTCATGDDIAMTTVQLRSGTLRLSIERADWPLDELCGFASRRSRKRGFVFVSKVLGKHYPVRPSTMARVHRQLAERLRDVRGPALLVAMAETATCLGQGVFEQWLTDSGRDDVLFLHTTRYRLNVPLALEFDESHSHATEQYLYEPVAPEHAERFHQARSLVLVDDELSTGRTLAKLAAAYRRRNGRLESVHIVCLTDWLDAGLRRSMADQIGAPTSFHSLLQGSYTFEESPEFDPGPIPDVTGRGDRKDWCLPRNHGRLGACQPLALDVDSLIQSADLAPGSSVLVLGSGEFSYPPYVLACRLEALGWDVHYQSSTRSPLLAERDLGSVLEFVDNYHDGIPNYVYNVSARRYDRILVGYETWPLPAEHQLPALTGARPLYFVADHTDRSAGHMKSV